ncbi:hypothetical protein EW145_g3688 [Phellinidium pouzarii]|uniref:Uncharacterized protein n=1 Tax=Phellinidium pouzarii TaxID=167371 RepID=A0A4V3XCS4_9AGAM|nr:hypothetical protein EW145_g3688 [Phellinidium pouzarii]
MRFREKPKVRREPAAVLAPGKEPDPDPPPLLLLPPLPSPLPSPSPPLSVSPKRNIKDKLKDGFNATAGALRWKIKINRKKMKTLPSELASAPHASKSTKSKKDPRLALLDLARTPAAVAALPSSPSPPSPPPSSWKDGGRLLKNAVEMTSDVPLCSLGIVASSADVFPPLKTAACVLQNVVDHLQCQENREEMLQLLKYVKLLRPVPNSMGKKNSSDIGSELES